MADKSKIQWTEATWNPVIGCQRVSEGCRHCYAEVQAKRIALMHQNSAYSGVLRHDETGFPLPMWNGKAVTMPDRLDQPLRWARPRLIFVNSMSDLFHNDVPFEFIAAVFGVMAAASEHRFQVLTKRPERMLAFFEWLGHAAFEGRAPFDVCAQYAVRRIDPKLVGRSRLMDHTAPWPSPNVWLGVSCEDQKAADERIPLLLNCPAAVRWVSAEPLLGPIQFDARSMGCVGHLAETFGNPLLHWVVVGGESGPGARACDINAVRDVVEQCNAAGVSVFVKQLGAIAVDSTRHTRGRTAPYSLRPQELGLKHPKGGDPAEWPEALRVREWPLSVGGAP